MDGRYIHIGSVTNAMRGKKLLEKNGIRAFVNRSAHPQDGDGCGYSLFVSRTDGQAERILRSGGIAVRRVSDNG